MLNNGTKLGPYEIVAPLGAGGMGEVYRARDTRLDRTVAIKILNSQLVASPELRARFEREAKVISQLQHPNICVLHDIGSENSTDFLVMEFLDGESLAERVKRGPLPTDELLKIAIEIADALEKAHRAGVVHRDLKPGNVMLTKSGAKLLDFGLAKSLATGVKGGAGSGTSASVFAAALTQTSPAPSPASPLSTAGSVIGTVQYMSPEQIQGMEADARSDIFAFGVMLFEMATGKRAFEGKTQSSIVGQILAVDPPSISSLRPTTPSALSHLVSTCLEKDPEERYQTIHDVKLRLAEIAEAPAAAIVEGGPSAARSRVPWLVAAVAVTALIAIGLAYVLWPGRSKSVIRSFILPPEKTSFVTGGNACGPPALSPDGANVAFTGRDERGKIMLYVRPLDSLTAQPLAGTDDATFPFWSPDSRWIGFFSQGKLRKVEARGGPPQALCDVTSARGGAWNSAGDIVFAPSSGDELMKVSAAGGTPVPASKLDEGQTSHRFPEFLPDGRHFLFYSHGTKSEKNGIYVGSLDSLKHKMVLANNSVGYYVRSGYLLFVREQVLMAQPFNPRNLTTTGDAFPVAEHVAVNGNIYLPIFSTSETGLLLYQTGDAGSGSRLLWMDREGKTLGDMGETSDFQWPAISPDGRQVAVSSSDASAANRDIWTFDSAGHKTRLTFDPSNENRPLWAPDGKTIFFASDRKGQDHIYAKASDGSGSEEAILETGAIDETPMDVSRDGRYLVYHRVDPGSKSGIDIWVLPLFGDRKPFPIVATAFTDVTPAISPDGKWLAYSNNETGTFQVYMTVFPGGGPRWQVSTEGGHNPRWRRDGKELFFNNIDRTMAVDVGLGATSPKFGTPRLLFQAEPVSGPFGPFDVSADGKRFLVNATSAHVTDAPLTLVANWTVGLKK